MSKEEVLYNLYDSVLIMSQQFISEQEIAETYDPKSGWKTVTQYRESIRLREENPEMARAEIARQVGRPASAVRGWLKENKTPRVVSGIRIARNRGWLDIDPDSERFSALNKLVAWIFSGGGISVDTFVPHFSVDDPVMLTAVAHQFGWLQLAYRCRNQEDPAQHLEVTPAEGGAVLGRVLSLLGAPRGVKAQLEDISLPSYLSTVGYEHQRDFVRIYLLNRRSDPEQTGSYIQSIPSEAYANELRDLIASVTTGSATVGHQNRIWVSAESLYDLTEHSELDLRSGLATAAVYGSFTPPTERAITSTFRRTETPGGYRYHQHYTAVHDCDDSRRLLASELGIPESTIQSWRRGSRPYATNAVERAQKLGWLTPRAESETATAMTGLLTWLLARGSLRETYYPVFRANTPTQQERFASIADTLAFSYDVMRREKATKSTELRPTGNGTLLGRVLYVLGAPRQSEPQTAALLPTLAYHYPCHAQQVAEIWCLHHAETPANNETPFTITVPPRAHEQLSNALVSLLSTQLDWTIEQPTPDKLIIKNRPKDAIA
jgi:hypothetical protein